MMMPSTLTTVLIRILSNPPKLATVSALFIATAGLSGFTMAADEIDNDDFEDGLDRKSVV